MNSTEFWKKLGYMYTPQNIPSVLPDHVPLRTGALAEAGDLWWNGIGWVQLEHAFIIIPESAFVIRPAQYSTSVTSVENTASEAVVHPPHYGGDVPHETWKCLEAWGLESDALLWTVAKYISRADKKGDKREDLKKAKFYLERRIASLEGKKP